MTQTVHVHRFALLELLRRASGRVWLVSPRLGEEAVRLLLPELEREAVSVAVLTDLGPGRLTDGSVEPEALELLAQLPGCDIRTLPGLAACVYAAGPGGPALISSSPLTMAGLDESLQMGVRIDDAAGLLSDVASWWESADPVSPAEARKLAAAAKSRRQVQALGEEIARVGAFVRVSVRGTRRTRRVDPREFGVVAEVFGRAIRPVEITLYKLDDLLRAKDELEAALAEQGLEWNGYYLVPRHFLEQDWPRLFGARQRQLQDWLGSPEASENVKAQLADARGDLERFLGRLLPMADSGNLTPEAWVDQQTTRILAEAVSDTFQAESGLEYRVLTILPEDERSVEELQRLLQDPKLRSVQLTFPL